MSLVVAIDGPAGAGKSTVAQEVARAAGLSLVDTGAIYRAVTLAAHREELSLEDGDALGALARGLSIRFSLEGEHNRVFLGDGEKKEDITRAIRQPHISLHTSKVSGHRPVRAALLDLQRTLGGRSPGAVLEGRDIGSVVFPEASVKIFLTASAEERARRRALELSDRGEAEPYEKVLREIRLRDQQDSQREVAPLVCPEGAERLDSSYMTFQEVVSRIVEQVERVRGPLSASNIT